LLWQERRSAESFFRRAVELCACLGAAPVVLTIARSERVAQQYQLQAQEILAGHGISADFDMMIGADERAAVAHTARWRRCQAVVLEWTSSSSWWRWLRGRTTTSLLELLDTLNLLLLPEADPDVTPTTSVNAPALREGFPSLASADSGGQDGSRSRLRPQGTAGSSRLP
jgi:K+-sensing histidine kinase KdpD